MSAKIAVIAALAVSLSTTLPVVAQDKQIKGVARVIDGDTIEIHGERIRLSGFDAPERGVTCGKVNVYEEASIALANVVGQRTVSCGVTGADRYGRSVATCTVAGADLGELVVRQGWARDWPRYSGGKYASAEQQARKSQLGVWRLPCSDLWSGRDYR